jgi:hypothetical protein
MKVDKTLYDICIVIHNILRTFLGWQSLMRVSLNYKICQEQEVKKFDRIFNNCTYFKGRTCKIILIIFHIRVL